MPGNPPKRGPAKKLVIQGPRSKRAISTLTYIMQDGRAQQLLKFSLPNADFGILEIIRVDDRFLLRILNREGKEIVLDDDVNDFPSDLFMAKLVLFAG